MPTARAARRERLGKLLDDDEWLGPLHGIPIGIKDIIDVAGWPTHCGSPLRDRARRRAATPPVVARLRKAGAIILGKTVTTEWASFDPPPTRNPWNLDAHARRLVQRQRRRRRRWRCAWPPSARKPAARSSARPPICGVAGLKPGFGESPWTASPR